MSLSKKQRQQQRADDAWLRYQSQPRKAPVAPPDSVLLSEPYDKPEAIEERKISLAEQTGETLDLALVWRRHQDAHPQVTPEPGSFAEADALARIEILREEEEERERKRGLHGGTFVSERISGGKLIHIYRVGRGKFVEVES
jgi:hypothetical protein